MYLDRLKFCELKINKNGKVKDKRFDKSYIKSIVDDCNSHDFAGDGSFPFVLSTII